MPKVDRSVQPLAFTPYYDTRGSQTGRVAKLNSPSTLKRCKISVKTVIVDGRDGSEASAKMKAQGFELLGRYATNRFVVKDIR